MNNSDEEIQQKIYKIKKDYTLLYFGFLTAHCYVSTLINTRCSEYLLDSQSPLSIFYTISFLLVFFFFLKWSSDMLCEINDIEKNI